MSLDVYLTTDEKQMRDCPECGGTGKINHGPCYEFCANITHNLNKMAQEAGIYKHAWRPEELGITKAGELIEPLSKGLDLMRSDPERFRKFDAKNGWGTYEQFVPWIAEYLIACRDNPDARVHVSR